MNKLLWFFHVMLTLAFGLFGLQKVFMAMPDLIAQGMWWIEDFSAWQVRAIGALEVLGVLGLNMPYLLKPIPKRVIPLASACLALTMVVAIPMHVMRGDPIPAVVVNSILLLMAATLAVKRYGEFQAKS